MAFKEGLCRDGRLDVERARRIALEHVQEGAADPLAKARSPHIQTVDVALRDVAEPDQLVSIVNCNVGSMRRKGGFPGLDVGVGGRPGIELACRICIDVDRVNGLPEELENGWKVLLPKRSNGELSIHARSSSRKNTSVCSRAPVLSCRSSQSSGA